MPKMCDPEWFKDWAWGQNRAQGGDFTAPNAKSIPEAIRVDN